MRLKDFANHANALDENVYVHSHLLPSGSRNRPARRPAEMATADSPKDSEPPTVLGMPSSISYITLREKCQTIVSVAFARISIGYSQLPSKNGLDKSAKIAYNKSKESTPVDGLLPRL